MKKAVLVSLIVVVAALSIVSIVSARSPYQTDVNTVCGTNYTGCTLCHPNGNTSQLNQNADTYATSGACGICPNDPDCTVSTPTCTDADRDGYDAEGGDCGAIDCNDNNAAVSPGDTEVCNNNIDDDCDRLVDCADPNCAGHAACAGVCVPTARSERKACGDGIDNDCDGAADCADSDCRRNRACR